MGGQGSCEKNDDPAVPSDSDHVRLFLGRRINRLVVARQWSAHAGRQT
jgi:hypothetical protein